ncbi:uncharacterized protein NPIL_281051 [Nephila pilipes]|uniref:Uncharacterized protein n=1 Tax=Nephila pilipes TaxID=299642 RepID=A0A8X6MFC6_NEPPI|nr:uncharacterized protein NPIL_281051 [Nephila pilipes]
MGLVLGQGLKIFEITEQILQAPQYKEEMVKHLLNNIIEDRKSKEEESKLDREREFELQKLKMNIEAQKNCIENGITPTTDDELPGTACADSGASHCIAGELLYEILKKRGADIQKPQLTMSLAEGTKNEVEAYTTCVDVGLEGRINKTNLTALPHAKENRTLLGTDFLKDTDVVLDLKDRNWYFNDFPHRKFEFEDGSYIIVEKRFPTTYEVAHPDNPGEVLGQNHTSALQLCKESDFTFLGKRRRPKTVRPAVSRMISRNQRGSVTNREEDRPLAAMEKKQAVYLQSSEM